MVQPLHLLHRKNTRPFHLASPPLPWAWMHSRSCCPCSSPCFIFDQAFKVQHKMLQ